jgi:hypothetical protein
MEVTGKYAVNIVIKHAKMWNYDRNGGGNLCYKLSQQTKSIKTNA